MSLVGEGPTGRAYVVKSKAEAVIIISGRIMVLKSFAETSSVLGADDERRGRGEGWWLEMDRKFPLSIFYLPSIPTFSAHACEVVIYLYTVMIVFKGTGNVVPWQPVFEPHARFYNFCLLLTKAGH